MRFAVAFLFGAVLTAALVVPVAHRVANYLREVIAP